MAVNVVHPRSHFGVENKDLALDRGLGSPELRGAWLGNGGSDMGSTSFNPLGLPNTTTAWASFGDHDAIAQTNQFDLEPAQIVIPQEVESKVCYSNFVSPQDTTFNLSNHELPGGRNFGLAKTTSPIGSNETQQSSTDAEEFKDGSPSSTISSPSAMATAAADRSQRARNAANRRHSRAKGAVPSSGDRGTKQDIEREKNRIAAAKCRKKKRAATDALDAEYRAATTANKRMTQEHRELRDQLACWRMLALQHVNGLGGCRCMAIHRYNTDQAMKAVCDMDTNAHQSFPTSSSEPGWSDGLATVP